MESTIREPHPEPALNLFPALFCDLQLYEVIYPAWVGSLSFSGNLEIISVPVGDVFKKDEAKSKAFAFVQNPIEKRVGVIGV